MDIPEILKSESFIKDIILNINEGIYIINDEYKIVFVNSCANNSCFMGENVIGKSIFEVFPYLNKENSTFVEVFTTGKPVKERLTAFITTKGERKISINSTFPIFDGEKMIGAYEITQDVSAITNLSEELSYWKVGDNRSNYSKAKEKIIKYYTIDSIIGSSKVVKKLKEDIILASQSNSSVFIYGETGTGKEIVAQSIYSIMNKTEKMPFVAQNCAAIPEALLESLLFGTVKGSFTGAENKAGLFELANNGVLFLDEINSMPLNLQAKLLRVIEEGKVRRVGGDKEISVNIKLISSTNVQPRILLESEKIRKDLYYRLNVLYLELLPLKERKEDIPLLIKHFVEVYNLRLSKNVNKIDDENLSCVLEYDWPGNIRELKNYIERIMNNTKGDTLKFDNSFNKASYLIMYSENKENEKLNENISLKDAVGKCEIEIIINTLKKTNGNVAKAARSLDLPQQTLDSKIDKYKIREYVIQLRSSTEK